MSNHLWRKGEVKRFEFFRGGDKTEYLFAVALALIVVGALAMTLRTTFFPPAKSYKPVWVKCEKCGSEFEVDANKHREVREAETPAGKKQDCPKCGAKRSSWVMNQCPNPQCGKYFIRPSLLTRGAKDVCPYCKADYLKALDEKIRSMPGK